ncbi:MAG: single-stranded DNA-binding protein [Clostridia bacterium]|nr:single-stranded DNA-binding protein [Clostridia bacterium]
MSINHVTLAGNLTRDVDLRSTASGTSVMKFGIAVNERVKNNQTGEWEDRPNFVDCTMFGTRAEAVSKYLSKGSKVALEGKLRWSQWEKDGQKQSKLEVIVDEIEFMSRSDSQQTSGYSAPSYTPAYSAPDASSSVYDEDIPF